MTSTTSSFLTEQHLRYAVSSVQGRRPYNEDRSNVLHPLVFHSPSVNDSSSSSSSLSVSSSSSSAIHDHSTSYFGVFDGHGGEECAEWVSQHLQEFLLNQSDYETACEAFLHSNCVSADMATKKETALTLAFNACDSTLLKSHTTMIGTSGTTVGCLLIDSHWLYSANCGDSRSVLSRRGKNICLTRDHKPSDPVERSRIEAAGGKVSIIEPPASLTKTLKTPPPSQSYVEYGDLGLAVSRALGDVFFKQHPDLPLHEQMLISSPYTCVMNRDFDGDEFIVLATDGLWNFIPEERIMRFVRERLLSDDEDDRDLQDIAHKLTQLALDKKSNDNVTVVLIVFPTALDPSRLRRNSQQDDDSN